MREHFMNMKRIQTPVIPRLLSEHFKNNLIIFYERFREFFRTLPNTLRIFQEFSLPSGHVTFTQKYDVFAQNYVHTSK